MSEEMLNEFVQKLSTELGTAQAKIILLELELQEAHAQIATLSKQSTHPDEAEGRAAA